MRGVVPAAGEGTRLRPLTDDRPKGLVEVGGRPLLAYPLDTLCDLGVEALVVVVGYRGDRIRDRFGEVHRDTPIRYVEQPEPRGLARAVLAAEPHVEGDFLVLNGDNVVDADLGGVVDRHLAAGADATVVVEEVAPERAGAGGVMTVDDEGRPTGVVEKPADPPSTTALRGFLALSPLVFPACELVRPSATGEYELSAALDLLVHAGATVEAVPLEGRMVNVNTPDDVAAAERLLAG